MVEVVSYAALFLSSRCVEIETKTSAQDNDFLFPSLNLNKDI